MNTNPRNPSPLYQRFSELFQHGFTLDWVTAVFLTISQLVALLGTPLAYYFAPEGFWKVMLVWTLIHLVFSSVSITLYAHRLVSHRAAKVIHWPVHLLFGVIGQTLAVEGSVRRWAAMHVIHHGVDRSGKHHLDPYSATWFRSGWRNFLWSHMLTYYFFHPDTQETEKAYQTRREPILVWQDKYYLPLMIGLNFVLPLGTGMALSGSWIGGVCLLVASVCAFVCTQHITWTVNSVTHMWGFKKGVISSAKNNYLWLLPLGEGNHHADHHDFACDYRNGFGWSGWLLDPTRYGILLLRSVGLVLGLRRASQKQEADIIARRKLLDIRHQAQRVHWQEWEARLEQLKSDWIEATQQWEAFKIRHLQLRRMALPSLECQKKLTVIKAEMELARRAMRAKKQAFWDALYELQTLGAASA